MQLSSALARAGLRAYRQHHWRTAARQFQEAARLGNAAAEYNLGRLYALGAGRTHNLEKAQAWQFKAESRLNAMAWVPFD